VIEYDQAEEKKEETEGSSARREFETVMYAFPMLDCLRSDSIQGWHGMKC